MKTKKWFVEFVNVEECFGDSSFQRLFRICGVIFPTIENLILLPKKQNVDGCDILPLMQDKFLEEMSAGSIIAINMVGGKLVAPVIAFITLISEKNQFLSVVQQVGDIWNADEERKGAGVHNPIKGKFILNSVSMNFGEVNSFFKNSNLETSRCLDSNPTLLTSNDDKPSTRVSS